KAQTNARHYIPLKWLSLRDLSNGATPNTHNTKLAPIRAKRVRGNANPIGYADILSAFFQSGGVALAHYFFQEYS
ncbi:MAG: hypothetical protein JXR56_08120, partial [Candidatus Cloacimonetes bacterium]|nr:hypothetical protein [Candidatus Cloacimonadota bacterium]